MPQPKLRATPEKPLPLPGWAPPWWIGAGLIALWLAGIAVGFALRLAPGLIAFVAFHGWQAPAAGSVLLALFFLQRVNWARRDTAAGHLGLSFRPRVFPADLEPYGDFTLFALTDSCKRWAGHHVEGRFNGETVRVFTYGFVGKFRTTDDRTVTWPGQQTVFILPDLAGVPDFHLAPAGSDWGDLIETRLWSLDAGDAVLEVEWEEGETSLLRGRDARALKALFRRDRRDDMGLAPGWTIECHGGRLMLYRDRKTIGIDELARYLDQVTRVAFVLRAAAPPPRAHEPDLDPRVRDEPT